MNEFLKTYVKIHIFSCNFVISINLLINRYIDIITFLFYFMKFNSDTAEYTKKKKNPQNNSKTYNKFFLNDTGWVKQLPIRSI